MSSKPSDVRMTNVKRAIKGAEMAGITVGRVEVNPRTGVVSIVPKDEARISEPEISDDGWDHAIAKKKPVPVR